MKRFALALLLLAGVLAGGLYAWPAAFFHSTLWLGQQLAGLSPERVETANLSIHYYQGGPEDGETILMIHGFAASKDNWLPLARHLTDRYRVIAIDLPGFGDSSKPEGSYDVGTQVERIARFTHALQLDDLHLIGNSMGGHISALYAARYPQQVRTLALIANAGITAPRKSELFARLEGGEANPLVVKSSEDFQRLLDFLFVEPPALPAPLQRHLAGQAVARSQWHERIFAQLVQRYIPLEPELGKIQAPTLLLWGEQDRVLDVSSIEVMQARLKQAEVVVMPDTGHAPMIERPDETARHYQAFLAEHAPGAAEVALSATD